ncbi:hypothetical protein [Bacillus cereus group sp. BfR-BA-01380]|uniref:hypothetical protein n=1 Tax=Bacillus cereus group sp. BfR-BA-01380 TaxID=2920324 RepID=UPI001F570CFC|nr:hypothetical protein [Bacillus cereus group sp. BfR-BA-01380]
MKQTINLWSFIFSFICISLFLLYLGAGSPYVTNSVYFHPLFFLLILTIGTFFAGMIGFSKINNWISMLRSVVTVLLTFSLSVFLTLILIVGYALS